MSSNSQNVQPPKQTANDFTWQQVVKKPYIRRKNAHRKNQAKQNNSRNTPTDHDSGR